MTPSQTPIERAQEPWDVRSLAEDVELSLLDTREGDEARLDELVKFGRLVAEKVGENAKTYWLGHIERLKTQAAALSSTIERLEQERKAAETRIEALCQAHETQFERAEAADATIERLEQEREEWLDRYGRMTALASEMELRAEAAEAALVRYGKHLLGCDLVKWAMSGFLEPKLSCTCGLTKLLPDERPTPTEET